MVKQLMESLNFYPKPYSRVQVHDNEDVADDNDDNSDDNDDMSDDDEIE
jgi:hypothetical protein